TGPYGGARAGAAAGDDLGGDPAAGAVQVGEAPVADQLEHDRALYHRALHSGPHRLLREKVDAEQLVDIPGDDFDRPHPAGDPGLIGEQVGYRLLIRRTHYDDAEAAVGSRTRDDDLAGPVLLQHPGPVLGEQRHRLAALDG